MVHWFILLLLAGLFGCLVTALVTPFLIRFAHDRNILAYPGGRKLHSNPTALLGGAGVFLPFALLMAPFLTLTALDVIPVRQPRFSEMLSLCVGAAWMLVLGTYDDKYRLGWKKKILGQLVGIAILVLGGHSIKIATIPFVGPTEFGWLSVIVFAGAVLVITNAVNLIDGLDGLAGGICFFAALTSGVIGFFKGDVFTALIGFTISGSLLGFLRYNFPPASIYMGDGGSLMLGYLLGTLATSGAAVSPGQRFGAMTTLLVPFLPFGIALFDVLLAVMRRWISGRKIFWADSDHLHHRLMERFRRPRRVIALLYSFSALLSAMTLCVVLGPDHRLIHGFIYLSVAILIAVVVYSLKLYRIEHLSRTLENRPHFKFLTGFQSFMFMRIGRAASPSELVSLLESGVRDLDFDSVEVHGRDHCISSWSKTAKAHPDGMRNTHERVLDDIGLKVRYVIPVHDSPTYQKCLETTWFRILTQWAHRYEGLTASPLPPGAILGGPITRNRTAGP